MEWLPIETAPKGSLTVVLGFRAEWSRPYFVVWVGEYWADAEDSGLRIDPDDAETQPAYWLPVPMFPANAPPENPNRWPAGQA